MKTKFQRSLTTAGTACYDVAKQTIKLISTHEHADAADSPHALGIGNDADPRTLVLDGVQRVDLHFPKFSDGRAFSQAFLLRRRLGFRGEIRATGDVLVDQLVQMQRTGFDSAVLRADQDLAVAQRQFDRYSAFYQGDAVATAPHFAREAS